MTASYSPLRLAGFLRRRQRAAEALVLAALATTPGVWVRDEDLRQRTGMSEGRFYPAIGRLEEAELVEAQWDPTKPQWSQYRLLPEVGQ